MDYRHRTQLVSDVTRDGLGLELLDEAGEVVAEVFRSDANHTVSVSTFNHDVPFGDIERLLSLAKERLHPFADGTALDTALTVPSSRAGD